MSTEHITPEPGQVDEVAVRAEVAKVLNSWPSAGVVVAIVRKGRQPWFHSHGVADVATGEPATEDTVFRVGSLTKTVTAVAIMQLWEQGRIDLDAPANRYLTTFRLTPTHPDLQPATVRHLLTHTSGVGYWRRLPDLLRPGFGAGISAPRPVPLADYYRRGLPQEIQPGRKWAYSNHGFAALGQIVEDVSGQTLTDYFRMHIFDPLGMDHTDLVRSGRVSTGLATGYVIRRHGLVPVADFEVPTPGGGGLYSTAADMARYTAALLQGGTSDGGPVLRASTAEMMFQPHFQPDPRLPGVALGFDIGAEGDHRTVGKGGILSGFLAHLGMAQREGIGVVVLTNTGAISGQGAAYPLVTALLRLQLHLPREALRTDVPPHAEVWSALCGWYAPAAGPVTNLFNRILMGAGVEVAIHRNQLIMTPLTPVPAMRKGMRLYPDNPDDPYAFRIEMSRLGQGTLPVVFTRPTGAGDSQLLMDTLAFQKRPDAQNPRRWVTGALASGAAVLTIRRARRR